MSAFARPRRHQHQHLALAGREAGEGGVLSAPGREIHEVEHDLLKARPRRLVLQKDVVAAVQLDELCPRDSGGQAAPFRDRADLVLAGVDDEGRRLDLAEYAGHVDPGPSLQQPRRHLAGAGPAAQLVEPADLRFTAARNEARREDLAEDRILLAPADPHQLQHGAVLALAVGIAAPRPAAGIAAVEHHLRDALRMARGVGGADRRTGRDPEQRERLLDSRGRHDVLEIADPTLERQLLDVAVRQPAAAVVPAQESEMVAEETDPVSPDGTLQLVLEVAEPVRRLDQDGARADLGPGELHAVFRAQVANALAKLRVHRRLNGL